MKFLRQWRPRHLLIAWSTYWLALALVALGPAIPSILRATGEDAQGSITGSMGDEGLKLTVIERGKTLWEGGTSLLALALWVLGPPVLLWLLWLIRRPQRAGNSPSTPPPALQEPTADFAAKARPPEARKTRD